MISDSCNFGDVGWVKGRRTPPWSRGGGSYRRGRFRALRGFGLQTLVATLMVGSAKL